MSQYCIHWRQLEATIGWCDEYFIIIIDRSRNIKIFDSYNIEESLLVDEILLALTCYNLPIPHDLRTELVTAAIIKDYVTCVHYWFDKNGTQQAKRVSQNGGSTYSY